MSMRRAKTVVTFGLLDLDALEAGRGSHPSGRRKIELFLPFLLVEEVELKSRVTGVQ